MTDPTFLLALAAAVLGAASMILHVVAPRTKNTVDDRLRDDIDEVLELARGRQSPAPAVKPPIGPAAVLALVVLGLGASSQLSCTAATLRQHGAAGATGFLDCEASDLPPGTMEDAVDLAIDGIARLIDGNGNVDTSKLKGDMSTARTDLKRCAIAGAAAALSSSSSARTLSGAPVPVADNRLRGAFTLARQELGWLPVRLADGTVL